MILDGKKVALEYQAKIREKILSISDRKPGLAFILIGDHPASKAYVKMKIKGCEYCGILSEVYNLEETVSMGSLLDLVNKLNANRNIDGILIQQPFPKHLDAIKVINSINPDKDVDGFHPLNLGKMLMEDESGLVSCTPLGILKLLEHYKIDLNQKHVVVVGRSLIVGRPIANLLNQKRKFCNATVTMCHSQTAKLDEITRSADVLISAIGKPKFITSDMVKKDSIVIDVGINRIQENGQDFIVGDVDFETVAKKTSYITPVPGGIGPMTIAMLLQNTLQSFLMKNYNS